MKSPPKQDTAQLLPPSRITSIVHCIPVLVQEESALVHRQLIEDKLRVKRILALGGLSTHGVIVTRRKGMADGTPGSATGEPATGILQGWGLTRQS